LAVRQVRQVLSESVFDTSGGLAQTCAATSQRTGKGGSEFTPVVVETPLDMPMAAVTVLFRPFPIEVGSTQAMVASLEGAFLLVLVVVRIRWVVTAFKSILRLPYVAFAFFYVGMFVVAYSSISNFGLLARQRVQALPVLLVLLCVPDRAIADHVFAHRLLARAGTQVLVPAGEVVKHRMLAPFSSGDGMVMRPGGEDLILVPSLNATPTWVDAVAAMAERHAARKQLPVVSSAS